LLSTAIVSWVSQRVSPVWVFLTVFIALVFKQFFIAFNSHRILGITEGITSLVFPYSFFKFLSSAIVSWVSQRVQVSTIWGFLTVFIAICSHRILGITEGITSLVGIKWDLFATLMLAWTIVYLIIWKGLHSSGKVRN
jgi:hypothetical protein